MHYPHFARRPHENYDDLFRQENGPFRDMLNELASPNRLADGRIMEISRDTGINAKTLEGWRTKLRKDPNYKAVHGHKGWARRLGAQREDEVAETIEEEYISQHRPCPRTTVAALLTSKGREIDNDFEAGRTLVNNFLVRRDWSIRTAHPRRRTEADDGIVASFVSDMQVAQAQFPDGAQIFNVDETCWRVINGRLQTVAPIGTDDVTVYTTADMKASLTAIAGCSKSGTKLPLWILAKGSTERCERKYRSAPRLRHYITSGLLIVDHTSNGWSDGELARRYLVWLQKYARGPCCLLWDLHSSHRREDVKQLAQELGMGLEFVPAGQTDQWQPLDRKIFGNLKMQSVKLFNEMVTKKKLTDVDLVDAIVILAEAWGNVTQEAVVDAWSIFE